jgi:RNA polymerase sigma-70 factor (ECF subfamily)
MLSLTASAREDSGLEREDERSVRAFLSGDRRAFGDLARTYRSRIFAICYRYTGNREDAEDLVQDVLLRAFRGLPGFRGEARFRTWLYRIAVNACLNWIAVQRRPGEPLPPDVVDPAPTPAERFSRRESAAGIRRAVSKLPDRQRMTLLLRVYEELSYREISEVMGCPTGTAKANFFFALKNLRKLLERGGAPDHVD